MLGRRSPGCCSHLEQLGCFVWQARKVQGGRAALQTSTGNTGKGNPENFFSSKFWVLLKISNARNDRVLFQENFSKIKLVRGIFAINRLRVSTKHENAQGCEFFPPNTTTQGGL